VFVTFTRPYVVNFACNASAYRKPFISPTPSAPLVVRSVDYAGEEHPATAKRVIVVPVAHLNLRDEGAIHKIKLLAGPRWTPDPPADSGVGRNEAGGEHGYIKIACEDFPQPAMNLKWASDTLDRLISEANASLHHVFSSVVGSRHV
jgi:small subunit ribosomal protein S35